MSLAIESFCNMWNTNMMRKTSLVFSAALAFLCLALGVQDAFAAQTLNRYFAHPTVEDAYGVIAPWYKGQNGQFDYRVRIASETLRRYPWVTTEKAPRAAPEYAFNNTWQIAADGKISIPGLNNWYNAGRGQGSARVMMALAVYYSYSGDPAAKAQLEAVADTLVQLSQTNAKHPWPHFLISVPVQGAPYGQASPEGWIQLDIVAEAAVALLRGYQLTGNTRWFETAKHWADVFVANRNRTPSAAPWGRYANPEKVKWGLATPSGNRQTGGLVYQLTMLDELIRLGYTGHNNELVEARDAAREYMRDVLLPAWSDNDTWGRNYWDWEDPVQSQTTTDWTARYLMDHKEYFPNWKNDVRNILTIFLNHTSVDPAAKSDVYSGAWAFPESSGCCGPSLVWGPMELALDFARYGVEANDRWAKEIARRQQTLATYDVHDSGVVEDNIDGGGLAADDWMNAAVPSALEWVLETMGWLPDILGASRENHIMRSSAVVDSVIYGKGKIQYTTFDAPEQTIDVLRLAFTPKHITAGSVPLVDRQSNLNANGYTVMKLSNGDCIVSIRHDRLLSVTVEGTDPQDIADDSALRYRGDWSTERVVGAWGGYVHTTSRAGAEMEFAFQGNQLRLLSSVGPLGGKADVYMDGVKQLVGIDFWNPHDLDQQIVYYKNGLSQRRHVIKLVARSDNNPMSTGNRIRVDAVEYSAAVGETGYGLDDGPLDAQRMVFGYTGRQDYIDRDGHTWRPGTEFIVRTGLLTDSVAHTWLTMKQSLFVAGTADPELYQYGVHAPEFTVNVTVGSGNYHVRLKFAENQYNQPNQRAVSVFLNDRKVVDRMDILATAHAVAQLTQAPQRDQPPPASTAFDLIFNNVRPRNGIIALRLVGESLHGIPSEAILQALEVGPGDGGLGANPVGATAQ
jgi:hypothetical protein